MLSSAWRYLSESHEPGRFFQSPELYRKAWGCIPDATLRMRAERHLPVDWLSLLPHQYAEWLSASDSYKLPAEAAERCPIDVAILCLEERGTSAFAPETLRVLIRRAAPRFAPYLRSALENEREFEVENLLACTPREASAALIEKLPQVNRLLQLPSALLNLIRKFLGKAVRERHPEYALCYEKLLEIEAGVGPLRRLS